MSFGPILLIGLCLVFFTGVVGLVLTWRGRPVTGTRVCRRCGFDLATNNPIVCPECGSNLQATGAAGPRRVRSKLRIGASLLLTVLPLSLILGLSVLALSTPQLNQLKPVWVLSLEAGGATGPTTSGAIDELTRRTKSGELSKAQLDPLVARAMKLRTTPKAPWNSAWSDFLEQARSSGHVDDAKWVEYIRQSAVITHRTRSKIRTGSKSVASISFSGPQLGAKTPPTLSIVLSAKLKERRIGDREAKGVEHMGMFGIYKTGSASTTHDFQCDAPPGISEIRTSLDISLIDTAHPGKILGSWQQDFVNPVEVVGPEGEIVEAKDLPELTTNIKRSLQIQSLTRSSTSDLSVVISVNGASHDLAFDVILRPHGSTLKEAEVRLGQISFLRGAINTSYQAARRSPDFDADVVDVILRPSVVAAEKNPDLNTVWIGPDLIFENIRILPEK